jgi:hypothetical protein
MLSTPSSFHCCLSQDSITCTRLSPLLSSVLLDRVVLEWSATESRKERARFYTDSLFRFSYAAADLTELYLCACDVEGYRNLMQELGLKQDGPTVIWQDNQAAIQIAMNRGSLAKKTQYTIRNTQYAIRNKIEDMKVVPMYLRTCEMIADIGTKALEPKLFTYLRDK